MEYSNKVQIKELFKTLQDENVVIIKLSEDFPKYYSGSDIDMFCADPYAVARKILAFTNRYIFEGAEVRVKHDTERKKMHIDIFFEGDFDIRFDLHGALPRYKNVRVKREFFPAVLSKKKKTERNGVEIFVPSDIDEMVLRYIEFHEYFNQRPKKVKHLDYVVEKDNPEFLNRLHAFIKYVDVPKQGFFEKIRSLFIS